MVGWIQDGEGDGFRVREAGTQSPTARRNPPRFRRSQDVPPVHVAIVETPIFHFNMKCYGSHDPEVELVD